MIFRQTFLVSCLVAALASVGQANPPAAADLDLQGLVDAAVKAGQRTLVIPPGRYRVKPQHGRHLALKGVNDFTLVATGVEMVCTETVRAIDINECRNVVVRGLTIDYDPLPVAQGRITALAPDKSWVEFQIIDGYPDQRLEERVEIYDPATRELRRTDAGWSKQFDTLGEHRYRIAKGKHYRYRAEYDTEQVGDILVTINRSPNGPGGHAIETNHSSGVRLEDITLYSSPTFGFVEHQCDGTVYLRCKIDRRAPDDDPVRRGFPRMRSLTADAFHSVGATKGPSILACTAKFQGDDCVNIHGSYHMVMASRDRELRLAVLRKMTIEPGDPVEFLPYEGKRPADAAAVKIEPTDESLSADELAFLRKLNMHPEQKQWLLDGKGKIYRLTLDRPVPLAMGSAVCSGNRVGNGFAVKDCDFGYNRSRGILIKASRGEVSGNTITNGWMAAVLVAPEFWWSEAASSSDLVIANNKIIGCRWAGIDVIAPGGNGKMLPAGAHRNIRIENNLFERSLWPNIHVTSTEKLSMKDNRLTPADPTGFVPPIARTWNWNNVTPAAVWLEQCE